MAANDIIKGSIYHHRCWVLNIVLIKVGGCQDDMLAMTFIKTYTFQLVKPQNSLPFLNISIHGKLKTSFQNLFLIYMFLSFDFILLNLYLWV